MELEFANLLIVAATAIGTSLGAIEPGTAAALIAAGLLTVILFRRSR